MKDRISKWMEDRGTSCVLCEGGNETLNHIMVECLNTREIRAGVFRFLERPWVVDSFEEELKCMHKLNRKKTDKAKLIVTC